MASELPQFVRDELGQKVDVLEHAIRVGMASGDWLLIVPAVSALLEFVLSRVTSLAGAVVVPLDTKIERVAQKVDALERQIGHGDAER